jgi:hypothetical protein
MLPFWLVTGWKKKKSKIRNAVEKGSGKSDETEERNTWKRNKPANMAKGEWERATEVTVENYDRQTETLPFNFLLCTAWWWLPLAAETCSCLFDI